MEGLERPPIGFIGQSVVGCVRPFRTLVNPCAEQRDLFGGEAVAFGGHDDLFIEPGDKLNEGAFRAFARNDVWRVVIAAGERNPFEVEPVTILLFLFPMTAVTGVGEDWLNVLLVFN